MIHIRDVIKNYQSGDISVHALKGISLDIPRGSFISIAGPSGSGKTTLLNCVGCIDTVTDGLITINGNSIVKFSLKEMTAFRRDNLGFIFQSFNLIPVLTAYENVSIALSLKNVQKKEILEKTMTILKEVGLEGLENRRPSQLSGGQQQRVAIARALVKEPSLILADEPTANLDSNTGSEILDLMRNINLKYKTTFIFSTHDLMVMERADKVINLHDGLIVPEAENGSSDIY
ncbi:ABC transporter ATP-binding protein [Spirochaeta cellobiosiphila]|uniref:ABC transporter ATP-binding protein n=1 Tax=Spirochaeta cellobiosiphila TaxID=504483 RepID=UPI000402CFE9|nr:ABC transporter ATP-binding protein [Spirochaeta cellobiosiphila]